MKYIFYIESVLIKFTNVKNNFCANCKSIKMKISKINFFRLLHLMKIEISKNYFCHKMSLMKVETDEIYFLRKLKTSNLKAKRIYFCSKLQTFQVSKKVLKFRFQKVGLTRLNGYFRGAKTEIIRFLQINRVIENESLFCEKKVISLTY